MSLGGEDTPEQVRLSCAAIDCGTLYTTRTEELNTVCQTKVRMIDTRTVRPISWVGIGSFDQFLPVEWRGYLKGDERVWRVWLLVWQ